MLRRPTLPPCTNACRATERRDAWRHTARAAEAIMTPAAACCAAAKAPPEPEPDGAAPTRVEALGLGRLPVTGVVGEAVNVVPAEEPAPRAAEMSPTFPMATKG
mmetsp:Transcript_51463/g.151698  ORF Transcript_51463/g.151698 Transcript_51463/m.151698 type:complete len:104 (+) Transcript_51463:1321-1632(+)